jgi:hypothetical protein
MGGYNPIAWDIWDPPSPPPTSSVDAPFVFSLKNPKEYAATLDRGL